MIFIIKYIPTAYRYHNEMAHIHFNSIHLKLRSLINYIYSASAFINFFIPRIDEYPIDFNMLIAMIIKWNLILVNSVNSVSFISFISFIIKFIKLFAENSNSSIFIIIINFSPFHYFISPYLLIYPVIYFVRKRD
jgi:hypothetical protein